MTRTAEDLVVGAIIFFIVWIIGGIILSLIIGLENFRTAFLMTFFAGIFLGGGGFLMFHKKG